MALTLTVGENTYITQADADSYFGGRLYSTAWTNAATGERDQALVMATKAIDRLALRGSKADSSQPLQFPRCYVNTSGTFTCEDAVPQIIADAVCEEALALLGYDSTNRVYREAEGLKSKRVGDISEEYGPGRSGLISPDARALVRPYLAGAVAIA